MKELGRFGGGTWGLSLMGLMGPGGLMGIAMFGAVPGSMLEMDKGADGMTFASGKAEDQRTKEEQPIHSGQKARQPLASCQLSFAGSHSPR